MTTSIELFLRCVPPSVTAQQKRVRVVRSKRTGKFVPSFFHGKKMRQQAATWEALLHPYQPDAPLEGPVALTVCLIYPHLKSTRIRDLGRKIPKVSKPDAGNAAKHIEDTLVRLRFIADDQQVARLTVEKWHGPEDRVGIGISIVPMDAEEAP